MNCSLLESCILILCRLMSRFSISQIVYRTQHWNWNCITTAIALGTTTHAKPNYLLSCRYLYVSTKKMFKNSSFRDSVCVDLKKTHTPYIFSDDDTLITIPLLIYLSIYLFIIYLFIGKRTSFLKVKIVY